MWSGRRGSNPRPTAWKAVTLPLSYSRLRGARVAPRRVGEAGPRAPLSATNSLRLQPTSPAAFFYQRLNEPDVTYRNAERRRRNAQRCGQTSRGGEALHTNLLRAFSRASNLLAREPAREEGWWGGEGSNLRSPKAADLQSAAIDHSATSPKYISCCSSGHDCFRSQYLYALRPRATALKPAHVIGIRVRCIPEGRREIRPWSWRRDLNPRPADYKSAALPD